MTKRQLSVAVFAEHVQRLEAKQCLTRRQLHALTGAINQRCSDVQAEQLLYVAVDVPTEDGILTGYEFDRWTERYRPVLKRGN